MFGLMYIIAEPTFQFCMHRDKQRQNLFRNALVTDNDKTKKKWAELMTGKLGINPELFAAYGVNRNLSNIIIDYVIGFPPLAKMRKTSFWFEYERTCVICQNRCDQSGFTCYTMIKSYAYCHTLCEKCMARTVPFDLYGIAHLGLIDFEYFDSRSPLIFSFGQSGQLKITSRQKRKLKISSILSTIPVS